MAKKGVFIDRGKIVELIRKAGSEQWENFTASELSQVGNAQRCELVADGKNAMLNLFFNNDGTTTITPTGKNMDISSVIKALLEEQCEFSGTSQGRTYSIKKLSREWAQKLVEYLSSLENIGVVECSVDTVPVHKTYSFTSRIGDKLTVNIYENGTLTLQGKPAYLYGEAISFLSYCQDVSVDDIIDSINSFHNVSIKTSEVRNDMSVLMPNSYGHIDEVIFKLLSPSLSLKKIKIELEDYSCYTFSALRALEAYIKYLLGLRGVTVGNTFYKIFDGDSLCPDVSNTVGNADYQRELERLYIYYRGERHKIFHASQILASTKVLESRYEADEIINMVINLIETSYISLFKP